MGTELSRVGFTIWPLSCKLIYIIIHLSGHPFYWFPVENREEPIKSVLSVRPCVRPTRIISETALRIFPKPGTKLGVKNVRNVARPLFLKFWPVLAKAADLCEKNTFLAIFGSFWPLRKIRSEDFS